MTQSHLGGAAARPALETFQPQSATVPEFEQKGSAVDQTLNVFSLGVFGA